MHRVLLPFEFFEPTTVKEVLELLDGEKTKVLAGGLDLLLNSRLRKIELNKVISLQKIPDLDYVKYDPENGLSFGAMANMRQIEQFPAVKKKWQSLYEGIHTIVSLQTKIMGTAVGNICVGTPVSDIAPPLFTLGAKVKIMGKNGEKTVAIDNFFVDLGKTILEPNEIVTEISVPEQATGTGSAFMRLGKTAEDIAKINAAVTVNLKDGICQKAKIALGAVAATPIRATEAEEAVKGIELDDRCIEKAAEAAAERVKPITDVRSTAQYRKEMVKVLVRDSFKLAIARASE